MILISAQFSGSDNVNRRELYIATQMREYIKVLEWTSLVDNYAALLGKIKARE